MSIKTLFSKLWQKIPAFTPYLWRTINAAGYFGKLALEDRCYVNFGKPVVFVLQCTNILKNLSAVNQVNQYDVEENISHLMSLARIALEKGDTERATAILEMGIRICEEYGVYVALPYMYDILASISFAMGNMEKAEHLLVSAIEKLVQIGAGEDENQVVDFQLRLARIYSAYEKNELAEIGFRDCLMKQKQKILDGDTSTKTGMLYVNVLFWYGLHKIHSNEHKSAKEFITSAYDYSLKIKGLSPYQEMVILYTLADLHMQLGENNLALQNMTSAILLGKGIGSTDMPRCYLKLAQIYMNLDAWKNAKESCQEAIKLGSLFNDTVVTGEAEFTMQKIDKKLVR
ncbi:tetratricopeptide repeat protein 19, mitochondrial-like [Anthonomus grandis grandis]|uniref:tetratricopeptide repeat protein 19, mitochondrial-like n=1 Tax=Anthonomus grandis grandis TaxID=2921223 RepID=UPI002165ED28|nr:tetratricopeptide repeat protein 19, mitochondrial-like [Anthonomus grandis grandis]